jgi:predicted nucleic acid-binding protein
LKIYFDTGLLLKLYAAEENSPEAVTLVQAYGAPICFTGFQHTELRNALHRKCARKEITLRQLRKSLAAIQSDLDTGVLLPPKLDWNAVLARADQLTDRYALSIPCRTLDVLPIATVMELGIKLLGSTDSRQMALARKAGLRIVTLPEGTSPARDKRPGAS